MTLPYWLLRLLPMWDYICPRCRREVAKGSHKCPYCEEQYGVPLRVPPRVLKDKEALEKYVHEKIFPKISAWQREYLVQFFTIMFQDGFESGDFSAWDSTNESGGTCTVESANPHHGTKDFKSHLNGGGTWQRAEVYKSIGAGNTVAYARHYEKLTALPSNGNFLMISAINQHGGSSWDVRMQIRNNGGQYQLGYRRYRPSNSVNYGNITIATGEWHCFEVYMKKDASAGEVGVYYDGNLVVSESGLDTSGAYLAYYSCGSRTEGWNCGGADFYLDCVVVADAYIGVEGEAPTIAPILVQVI